MIVKNPEDIAKLGWVGNWAEDRERFEAVNAYIIQEPDLGRRQRADQLATLHGMGINMKIDPTYDPLTDLSISAAILAALMVPMSSTVH